MGWGEGPLSFAVTQGLRLTQKLCHIQQVVSKIILGININNSLRERMEKILVLLYHFGLEVTTSSMPHSVGQDSGKWKMSFLTGQPFLHRNATLWKENMNLWRTAGFLTTAVNWLYDLSEFSDWYPVLLLFLGCLLFLHFGFFKIRVCLTNDIS